MQNAGEVVENILIATARVGFTRARREKAVGGRCTVAGGG